MARTGKEIFPSHRDASEWEVCVADNDKAHLDEVLKLLFEIATDTRKFEIDLFWKRSLFFLGVHRVCVRRLCDSQGQSIEPHHSLLRFGIQRDLDSW